MFSVCQIPVTELHKNTGHSKLSTDSLQVLYGKTELGLF